MFLYSKLGRKMGTEFLKQQQQKEKPRLPRFGGEVNTPRGRRRERVIKRRRIEGAVCAWRGGFRDSRSSGADCTSGVIEQSRLSRADGGGAGQICVCSVWRAPVWFGGTLTQGARTARGR